ncbi:MAG: tRNA (N(6)-L-threonylcarbamoyladenosine(37)-C(2))-methylthiotransferase MtaB [Flavobacteriales bacterium]
MNQYGKIAYHTLGCKLNFSETSTIAKELTSAGYARVAFDDIPDVYVINTCSVTDHADKKCRNIVRRALNVNPSAFIAVIGCYAQLKPKEIAAIEGVDVVLGANEKFNVQGYLKNIEKKQRGEYHVEAIKQTRDFVPSFSEGDRTRCFLKVQDGCNYFCSFCTIPLARGKSRSSTVAQTMVEAKKAAATAAKEIVLTGVNIGDFGNGSDENFSDLIHQLDTLNGIDRLRISSIEPNLLSDEIIKFCAASEKFVPHFHIPLQSGSDTILTSMRRRYKTELYKNRISLIKKLMPECSIGVDVIVGFPGETEEEFEKTYEFLHALPISYLHVFSYSERPNTTAVRKKDIIPKATRLERSKRLRILSSKKQRSFYQSFEKEVLPVLFESENHEGFIRGFTTNYLKVQVPYDENLINQIKEVHLEHLNADCIFSGTVKEPIFA